MTSNVISPDNQSCSRNRIVCKQESRAFVIYNLRMKGRTPKQVENEEKKLKQLKMDEKLIEEVKAKPIGVLPAP